MSDRQLVVNIIKQCKNDREQHVLEHYIDNKYAKFNNLDQCTHLYLSLNGLKDIPDELLELKHLEYLSLMCNKLTFIPDELNYIKELHTYGNPIFKSKDKIELLFNKNFKNN